MNKIHNILLGSAVLLTALAACSDHNEPETTLINPDRDAVTLDIHIEGAATTRADDDVEYRPLDGTELTLIYGEAAAGQPTVTYQYSAAQWQLQSSSPLYWDDLTAATGTPRYSFYAIANASFNPSSYTDGSVPADQGSVINNGVAKNYNDADLMMAYSYTEKRQSPVPITLKHLMAQFTIELKNDPAATGDALFTDQQLKDATATAKLLSEYTLAYPAISSKADANKATAVPATATAKAGAQLKDFTLLRTVHYDPDGTTPTTKVAHVSFTCIAPAQTLSSITITIGGLPYTYTPAGLELKAGVNTVQPLIAKKTGISLGTVKVTDWAPVTKDSEPLTADDITPGSESLSGIAEAGTLSLYAYKENGDPATSNPGTYPVTYDASGNKAAINTDAADGYSPILWDNLAKYADDGSTLLNYTYAATYVPTGYLLADATNTELHEKDLLGSISTPTEWGTAPSFVDASSNGNGGTNTGLKHLMARFTVKLTCTDDIYTAAELNAATLTTVRKKIADPNNPLDVSNTGVTLKTADATGGEAANTVTLVKTADATTGTGTDVLRLSITGAAGTKEYSLKKAVTLEGGKDYILTATLSKTELSIGAISVAPWDDSTKGDGNFEM